jgi:diketogulonate reductase-like aldo/keto reductase
MMPTARLPDGTTVAALGQGTWHMGEGRQPPEQEIDALRLGLDLGMTIVDTAEMYGDGEAERLVGRAVAGRRASAFIVSKVYPHNATRRGTIVACERSLKRLATEVIDLYLLHWPGSTPLAETVDAFEELRQQRKIRYWGVSNFDLEGMKALAALPAGGACATDQILYHPDVRGIEFDLLPWCAGRGMPLMAYSPLGQAGKLLRSRALGEVARRRGATAAQIAIAWSLRRPGIICIPKASDREHVRQNAAAAEITLSAEDLAAIDAEHPPPKRRQSLGML